MIKRRLLPVIISPVLFSCSESHVKSGEIEGFNGARVDAKEVDLYDWNIFSSDNGKWISISKNGTKIVSISEDGFGGIDDVGRTVTIHSKSQWSKVDLIDEESDNEYEIIEINSLETLIRDKGLDYEIDTKLEKSTPAIVKVNYEGALYPLGGDGKKEGFIIVGGERIEMKRDGFFWVPIQKTHNKLKNEDASKAGTDAQKDARPF